MSEPYVIEKPSYLVQNDSQRNLGDGFETGIETYNDLAVYAEAAQAALDDENI